MKLLLLCSLAFFVASLICGVAADSDPAGKSGKLNHMVAFKFKASATPEQIKGLVDAFRALPKKISQINHFEWGTNVSTEKFDKGFTHGFILSFKTAKDRDAYLVHEAHKEFATMAGPLVDDVFVLDFWAEK